VLPASVMLDRHGQPVLGVDGRPLVRDANGSLAGMLPPGVLLGADGRPILGADGRPLIRGIDGQTIGELPADVLLGADATPCLVRMAPSSCVAPLVTAVPTEVLARAGRGDRDLLRGSSARAARKGGSSPPAMAQRSRTAARLCRQGGCSPSLSSR